MPSRRRSRSRRSRSKRSRSKRSRSKRSRSIKSMSRRSRGKVKLLSIKKSPIKGKKLRASFSTNGKTKTVDFGASGYGDYIRYNKKNKTIAENKKRSYIARHKVRENFSNFMSPGSLSRYILWGKPSLKSSIADYKRRFNL